ncbi:hypothetical protein [Methylotuvimicrobium sp.]|uniref:hypothetical protein n=1 Tax=Methylotuvimicrobium sp. TaxID=2822413 RepID=UPI003D64EF0D
MHIVAHGGRESKTAVILNGVDLGFFFNQPRDDVFADLFGLKIKFVAGKLVLTEWRMAWM